MTKIANIRRLIADQKSVTHGRQVITAIAFFDQRQSEQAVEHNARCPRIGTSLVSYLLGASEAVSDQRKNRINWASDCCVEVPASDQRTVKDTLCRPTPEISL